MNTAIQLLTIGTLSRVRVRRVALSRAATLPKLDEVAISYLPAHNQDPSDILKHGSYQDGMFTSSRVLLIKCSADGVFPAMDAAYTLCRR